MNRRKTHLIRFLLPALIALICAAHGARAADPYGPVKTVENAVAQTIKRDKRNNIVTAVYENDLIGNGRDGGYTSGVRLGYIDINATFPEWAHGLAEAIPTFDINETSSIFYSIGHNIYTPDTITGATADPNDRPWAGYLYGSAGMVTLTDNHADEIELTLGVVGPAALGEQVQKAIHAHITDSPTPKGWAHQLKNEPVILLGWQRTWPQIASGEIGPLFWSASPHIGLTAGNAYTFANSGFSIRIGPNGTKWQDTPARVRPALPGSGFFEIPQSGWSWYLFAGIDGRAMARNIFLDGNSFTDSPSVDKKYFVADANAGLAVTYDQYRISYTLIHRTKEFETQNDAQTFGAISVGYRF